MIGRNHLTARQVRNLPRQLQQAVIRPRRQVQLLHRRLQQLLPGGIGRQNSRTSVGPISALQVIFVPLKRSSWRSRAACTLALIVFESSTLRLSASLLHLGCTFAMPSRSGTDTTLQEYILKVVWISGSDVYAPT
jgi:hypothetical protein